MKFRFTHHAEYRMFLERGISADDIKSAIKESDSVSFLPNGEVKCSTQTPKGTLVVVYKRERKVHVIITAYFK